MMIYDLRAAMIFLFFALSLSVVQAQESEDFDLSEIDCETTRSTNERYKCAANDYNKAKQELGDLYYELYTHHKKDVKEGRARGEDEYFHFDAMEAKPYALLEAKRDWEHFRESWCEYEGLFSAGGTGAGQGLLHIGCLMHLTKQQTERLREVLGN